MFTSFCSPTLLLILLYFLNLWMLNYIMFHKNIHLNYYKHFYYLKTTYIFLETSGRGQDVYFFALFSHVYIYLGWFVQFPVKLSLCPKHSNTHASRPILCLFTFQSRYQNSSRRIVPALGPLWSRRRFNHLMADLLTEAKGSEFFWKPREKYHLKCYKRAYSRRCRFKLKEINFERI